MGRKKITNEIAVETAAELPVIETVSETAAAPTEEKKSAAGKPGFPLKRGVRWLLQYLAIGYLLPAGLLCLAFLAFGGLVRDLKIGSLTFGGSAGLMVVGMLVCLAAAVYFFFYAFQYGSPAGYFSAQNSKKFKTEMKRLIAEAVNGYKAVLESKYDEAEKDILRNLQLCCGILRKYRKYYLANDAHARLEIVAHNEALKMLAVLNADSFFHADFLAAVRKVHFCLEERFTGEKAKAYTGAGEYTFISYSHRNSKAVLGVIKRLHEAKLNVWFDEGITEGEDWMDHIARKIDGCSRFLMFQTPAYAKSINCNVEIKRALKTNRTIIRVILEDSKLADGVEMYLDAIQGIDCRQGISEEKIVRIIGLLKSEEKKEEKPEPAEKPKKEKAKKE